MTNIKTKNATKNVTKEDVAKAVKANTSVAKAIKGLTKTLKDSYAGPQCTTAFIKAFGKKVQNAVNSAEVATVDTTEAFDTWRAKNPTASLEATTEYLSELNESAGSIEELFGNSNNLGRFNGTPWIKYVKDLESKYNAPGIYSAIADLYGEFTGRFTVTEKRVSKDAQRIAELEAKLAAFKNEDDN